MKTIKNGIRQFTKCDIAAAVLGVFLLVYFAATVRYAVAMPDEAAYWQVASRVSLGGRLITEEWHLTQFSHAVNIPLYMLYTGVTGSTEGIVLFARCMFIAVDLLFYGYMYVRLRRYGFAGAAAAFLFCALVPQLFFVFSYCTVSLFAVMFLCLVFFFYEKRRSVPLMVFCGVVLAVAVLENPFLFLLYVVWGVFVLAAAVIRRSGRGRKEISPPAEPKMFFAVALGGVLTAVLFSAFLLLNGAFTHFSEVLPYLFSGEEYNTQNLLNADQLQQALRFFGRWPVAGIAGCLAAAAALRPAKRLNRYLSLPVFCAACVFLAAAVVYGFLKTAVQATYWNRMLFCQAHNLPLLLFAPIPFLLDRKPDRRLVGVLAVGILYSLLMDIPSKSFLAAGGFVVRVPLILQLGGMLSELLQKIKRAPRPAGRSAGRAVKSAAYVLAAVCLSVCFVWDAAYIGAEGVYKIPERLFMFSDAPLGCTLSRGPLRGLKTTEEIGAVYNDTLADMDRIRENTEDAVAILDVAAFAYLYLNRPYGTFSVTYLGETERLAQYWSLPFTPKPAYLYLPFYNHYLFFRYDGAYLQEQLSQLRKYADFEIESGAAGYILRVVSINGAGE